MGCGRGGTPGSGTSGGGSGSIGSGSTGGMESPVIEFFVLMSAIDILLLWSGPGIILLSTAKVAVTEPGRALPGTPGKL